MTRHYIYISASKVDMYFGQLPLARRKKVAAELGFALGPLVGKVSTERDSLADPVERLKAVEKVVRDDNTIRTLGSTANWIADTRRMASLRVAEHRGLMFYICELEGHVFALGGSSKHILGTAPNEETSSGLSHAPRLLQSLEGIVTSSHPSRADASRKVMRRNLNFTVARGASVAPWTKLLDEVSQALDGHPKQNLQFLARVLFTEKWPLTGKRYTLATPLYVALADA